MKEKCFKKYTKEKRKAQSTRVSKPKKKKPGGNRAGILENARVQMHNTAQIRPQRLKRKTGSQAPSHAMRDQKV